MIDLKSVVEKYPECLDSAAKFKSYMMDLYPENADRARIKVLTDVINCGIVDEIKDGKTDSISIANYRDKMENAFGYSGRLVLESIMQWIRAFEANHLSGEIISTHNTPVVIDEIHTHLFVDTTVEPTCIEQGYTLHKCSCGYEYKDNFKPLVQHEFELVDKIEPTCISEGRKDFLCPVCSEYKSETIPKLPHQMSEWKILKNATCKENGLKERRCVFCGKTETEKILQLSHNWTSWTTQIFPTCTEDGKSARQCTACGEVEEKTLPAKDHDFSEWKKVAGGKWERFCNNCGKTENQTCGCHPNKLKTIKKVIVSAIALLLLSAFLVVLITYFIPEAKYKQAKTAIANNDYICAYEKLKEIEPYKNSSQLLKNIDVCYKYQRIANGNLGDVVTFGKYEQGDSEGTEEIAWQIIEKQGNTITLYSEKALVAAGGGNRHFNKESINEWINEDFAPTYAENEQIKPGECYLLNRETFEDLQTNAWFHDSASATKSASMGYYPSCVINSDSGSGCWFWLDSDCGTYVLGGRIYDDCEAGSNVFYGCVRPAITIDFSGVEFKNSKVYISN